MSRSNGVSDQGGDINRDEQFAQAEGGYSAPLSGLGLRPGDSQFGRWPRVARTATGAMLAVAAGAKFVGWQFAAGSSPLTELGIGPAAHSIAVVWELVLGLWLLSGRLRPLGWAFAVATFAGFTVISLALISRGASSCGCLGPMHVNPWVMLLVDMVALGLLTAGRPGRRDWRLLAADPGLPWVTGGLTAVAATMLACSWWAGSADAALARLRGDTLLVETPIIDFGTVRVGDRVVGYARVRNWGGEEVRIVGGRADCSCVVTSGLPVAVPPNGAAEVPVELTVPPSTPGAAMRTVTLYTSSHAKPQLRLRAGCLVESSVR